MHPRAEQRAARLSKKLFVGGLAWATDETSLRAAFEEYGPVVEAKVILDRETNRSRGFGFVTFQEDADADKAMKELDGAQLDKWMERYRGLGQVRAEGHLDAVLADDEVAENEDSAA